MRIQLNFRLNFNIQANWVNLHRVCFQEWPNLIWNICKIDKRKTLPEAQGTFRVLQIQPGKNLDCFFLSYAQKLICWLTLRLVYFRGLQRSLLHQTNANLFVQSHFFLAWTCKSLKPIFLVSGFQDQVLATTSVKFGHLKPFIFCHSADGREVGLGSLCGLCGQSP